MRTPRANDGAMAHTKSHRKLASEMREAQLKKEQREAPRRARLKVETTLEVAAFNDEPRANELRKRFEAYIGPVKGTPTIR